MSPLALSLYLAAFLWALFLWSRRHLYRLAWDLGGPIGLPLLGSALEFGKQADFVQTVKNKIWDKYKSPCTAWTGTELHIMVKDPETAREILTSNDFLDKHMMYKPFKVILGENSIILAEAKIWRLHRKAADPAFSYQNVLRLIPAFNKAVSKLITDVLPSMVGKGEVDVRKGLVKLFADLAAENTVGQNLNFLHAPNDEDTLVAYITKNHKTCLERCIKLYLHNDFLFKFTKLYKRILETTARIHHILGDLIRKYPDPNAKKGYTDGNKSVLHYLKQHEGEWTFSDTDLQYDMMTLMVASYETTSLTVFLILFYLGHHPTYQQRLFEELFNLFPEKNPQVELTHFKDLVYTEMVINEVLRLHPGVPMIGRKATKDTRLSTGHFIPKGTQVLMDLVHLHRNEDIWGPHADDFNPDNFLPEKVEQLPPNAFMPFSFGIRNCIGNRYAKTVLKIAVAKLVRTYRFKTSWTIKDVILIPGVVTTIENNPLIAVEERPK